MEMIVVEAMVLEKRSKNLVFRMVTLEPRRALWADMLLVVQIWSMSLRPLTTQASSTSRSRFQEIAKRNKQIDHLKLIVK